MFMAKTYLSGDDPGEIEQRTQSQINDARRPSSMAMSSQMMDDANDDMTPAIERRINSDNLYKIKSAGERKLEASPELDAQVARERAEKERAKKKDKKRKKQPKVEKTTAQNPEPERQKLDLDNIYPSAKPEQHEEVEKNWRKSMQAQKTLPERARIDNAKFADRTDRILAAFLIEATACLFGIISLFPFKNASFLEWLFNVIPFVLIILAAAILCYDFKEKKMVTVHFSQRDAYFWASVIPFLALRIGLATIIEQIIPNLAFGIDSILGTVLGIWVGAYIHYEILFNNKILYEAKLSLINMGIFSALYFISILFPALTLGDGIIAISTCLYQLCFGIVFCTILFFIDIEAGKLIKTAQL